MVDSEGEINVQEKQMASVPWVGDSKLEICGPGRGVRKISRRGSENEVGEDGRQSSDGAMNRQP